MPFFPAMATLLPMATAIRPRELVLPSNVLSLARIPLAAGFAVGVASGRLWIATAILLVSCATDVADGWFARRLKQETATGRVLDPLSDKLFFLTAAVALVATGRLSVVAVLMLSTREIAQLALAATLAARGRLIRTGTAARAHFLGKLTTTLLQTRRRQRPPCLGLPCARFPVVVVSSRGSSRARRCAVLPRRSTTG